MHKNDIEGLHLLASHWNGFTMLILIVNKFHIVLLLDNIANSVDWQLNSKNNPSEQVYVLQSCPEDKQAIMCNSAG